MAIGNNALSDFATAPTWAQDGMQDFVDQTDPTDQSADSTGCGMTFISWLMSQGYGLDKIAQGLVALTANGTFAQLYANLSGDSAGNAWARFQAAVNGLAGGVTNDDPFGGAVQPAQLAHLTPGNVELAGSIFSGILRDLVAGKDAELIVANVRAVVASVPRAPAGGGVSGKSRRLTPPGKRKSA
jgi:hypothetical protein